MKLHEEFREYETMWDNATAKEPATESLTEDWYGADSEVEFETTVYPDIAKYFGLDPTCKVLYAYYFLDEVIVDYEDVNGRSQQIEKHVPLDQVEEWFKAGYTIVDESDD